MTTHIVTLIRPTIDALGGCIDFNTSQAEVAMDSLGRIRSVRWCSNGASIPLNAELRKFIKQQVAK